ncbi:unnamed protein product, partial [Staurois parvus]
MLLTRGATGKNVLPLEISGKNGPYIGAMGRMSYHWRSVGRMLLTLGAIGKKVPYHWRSVGRTLLTLGAIGKNVLPLEVSGKNAPYIGGHWEECSLHWGPLGRMSYHWGPLGRMSYHWGPLGRMSYHWRSVGRTLLTVSRM